MPHHRRAALTTDDTRLTRSFVLPGRIWKFKIRANIEVGTTREQSEAEEADAPRFNACAVKVLSRISTMFCRGTEFSLTSYRVS